MWPGAVRHLAGGMANLRTLGFKTAATLAFQRQELHARCRFTPFRTFISFIRPLLGFGPASAHAGGEAIHVDTIDHYSGVVPSGWRGLGIFPLARVALASPRRRVGFHAVDVVAAERGCREQNAWHHSDSVWPVRSCVGRVYIHDQGKGRRYRTDSRYSRKDSQCSAASHRGCGGAHWRRCTSRGRQKGIDFGGICFWPSPSSPTRRGLNRIRASPPDDQLLTLPSRNVQPGMASRMCR
jgi:hypothetical protein